MIYLLLAIHQDLKDLTDLSIIIFLIPLLPSSPAKISFSNTLLIPETTFHFTTKISIALCWLDELPWLVDLRTYGLYTVHGNLRNGIKSSEWNTGNLLKALFKLLDESPEYTEITESGDYALPYCGHR